MNVRRRARPIRHAGASRSLTGGDPSPSSSYRPGDRRRRPPGRRGHARAPGTAAVDRRGLRPRRRLRRPAARRAVADLDPGHADGGRDARARAGDRRSRCAGRSPPTAASATSSPRRGSRTGPSRDHTVKVDVTGLAPGRWYHYRFTYDGARSRVGRTRTAPAERATPRRLRFGVVSCSNLQAGYFAAYRHLAAPRRPRRGAPPRRLPLRVRPGEYGYGRTTRTSARTTRRTRCVSPGRLPAPARAVQDRPRPAGPARAAARGSSRGTTTRSPTTRGATAPRTTSRARATTGKRRARAHRAYDEWMPVRMDGTADLGDGTRLFRRLRFGRLAEISHARPAHLPRPSRSTTPRTARLPAQAARSTTPTARSPARSRWRWLKDSLAREPAAVEARRQPGDDRAGDLRAAARRR